jgi:hypothetical protein
LGLSESLNGLQGFQRQALSILNAVAILRAGAARDFHRLAGGVDLAATQLGLSMGLHHFPSNLVHECDLAQLCLINAR